MKEPPCKDCLKFHQRGVGQRGGMRDARYGWCAAKSVYCHTDPDIPEGAATTTDPVSKPVIVAVDQIVPGCALRRVR